MGRLSILYELSDPSVCSCGKEDDCGPSIVGVGKIDLYSVDFLGDAIDEGADNEYIFNEDFISVDDESVIVVLSSCVSVVESV